MQWTCVATHIIKNIGSVLFIERSLFKQCKEIVVVVVVCYRFSIVLCVIHYVTVKWSIAAAEDDSHFLISWLPPQLAVSYCNNMYHVSCFCCCRLRFFTSDLGLKILRLTFRFFRLTTKALDKQKLDYNTLAASAVFIKMLPHFIRYGFLSECQSVDLCVAMFFRSAMIMMMILNNVCLLLVVLLVLLTAADLAAVFAVWYINVVFVARFDRCFRI